MIERSGRVTTRARARAFVTVAVAGLLVLAATSACASPAQRGGGTVDGLWRTVGYGQIVAVADGTARIYETTALSCLSSDELPEVGPADGGLGFGEDGTVEQALRVTGPGRAELRIPGTVGHIDLESIPELPANCSQSLPKDPLTTFDVFLATFAENYNSTASKGVDWAAVRDRYRPLVTSATSSKDLFRILSDVVRPLGDAHVEIEGPGDRFFSGVRPGTRPDVSANVRDALDAHLREDLGVEDIQTWAKGKIAYADLPDGRGYLRLTSFDGWGTRPEGYESRRLLLDQVLDEVVTAQRAASWRGLVIDVRYNSGGDDQLGIDLAGRLTDRPYTAYSKRARISPTDPTAFGPPRVVTVTPTPDRPRYTGPVRVLTSDLSVSAAETFAEATMGRTPAATRVGTATQGVFSDTLERTLPNGWSVTLGNERYTAVDGRDYEGVGVPPTIRIPTLTDDQLAAHADPALDLGAAPPTRPQ